MEVPRAVVISFLIYASFQAGCVSPLLFRKHSRWTSAIEPVIHGVALVTAAVVDFAATATLADIGFSIHTSKTLALAAAIFYLYYCYRFIVYSAKPVYG